jgi:hypothetical protein
MMLAGGRRGGTINLWDIQVIPIRALPRKFPRDKTARPVDLLRLIDPEKNALNKEWRLANGKLLSTFSTNAILDIPYDRVPREYVLAVRVKRIKGNHSFGIGLEWHCRLL